MKRQLAKALRSAENHPGWTRNSSEPWGPAVSLVSAGLSVPAEEIHACKVQVSSARKSLWQGKLHRTPIPVLLLAADHACDDSGFDRLSESVAERFSPPTPWADACIILSDGQVIGVVERDGVGLGSWLQKGSKKIQLAICSSIEDQLPLGAQVNLKLGSARAFVEKIEQLQPGEVRQSICELLGLDSTQVLISEASQPANAAKGRWEGSDVDPARRYRVAVVAADNWDWGSAALEMMQRMDPPELTLGVAILFAKSSETGPWDKSKVFINRNNDGAKEMEAALKFGGFSKISVMGARVIQAPPKRGEEGRQLRTRDADAGSIRYEASRPKQRVHDSVTNWLVQWGAQEGYRIKEGSDDSIQYDALVKDFYEGGDLLIEVKSTADRGVIRLAVGQLLDYGRGLKKRGIESVGAVLLPPTEKLSEDQREFLKSCGFGWSTLLHEKNGDATTIVLQIHNPDGTVARFPD